MCQIIFLFFNKQAEDALREQKLKYLQIWTLYSELKDLLIEYDIKKQDVHPSSATLQVRGLLENETLLVYIVLLQNQVDASVFYS